MPEAIADRFPEPRNFDRTTKVWRGARRFDDFHASLGMARSVLTARLKKLTDAGVLEKRRSAQWGLVAMFVAAGVQLAGSDLPDRQVRVRLRVDQRSTAARSAADSGLLHRHLYIELADRDLLPTAVRAKLSSARRPVGPRPRRTGRAGPGAA